MSSAPAANNNNNKNNNTMTTNKKKKKRNTKSKANNSSRVDTQESSSLHSQLDRAHGLVLQSKRKAEQLHTQWRAHMFRLSILVLLVSFQQSRLVMDQCMASLKEYNNHESTLSSNSTNDRIDGFQAARLILQDSMCEILGILILSCLARFLLQPPPRTDHNKHDSSSSSFTSNLFYLMATSMVPLQLGTYYRKKHVGCLDEDTTALSLLEEQQQQSEPRNFPVTLLFHAIVTAALWFMEWQMQRKNQDIQQVLDLRHQLETAQDTNRNLQQQQQQQQGESKKQS